MFGFGQLIEMSASIGDHIVCSFECPLRTGQSISHRPRSGWLLSQYSDCHLVLLQFISARLSVFILHRFTQIASDHSRRHAREKPRDPLCDDLAAAQLALQRIREGRSTTSTTAQSDSRYSLTESSVWPK